MVSFQMTPYKPIKYKDLSSGKELFPPCLENYRKHVVLLLAESTMQFSSKATVKNLFSREMQFTLAFCHIN